MLSGIFASIFFCFFVLLALLSDALRFARLGYIKAYLQKGYGDRNEFEAEYAKMEKYFEDDGRNLRELEWAGFVTLFVSLYYGGDVYLQYTTLSSPVEGLELLVFFGVGVFLTGGFFARIFSEPFSELI